MTDKTNNPEKQVDFVTAPTGGDVTALFQQDAAELAVNWPLICPRLQQVVPEILQGNIYHATSQLTCLYHIFPDSLHALCYTLEMDAEEWEELSIILEDEVKTTLSEVREKFSVIEDCLRSVIEQEKLGLKNCWDKIDYQPQYDVQREDMVIEISIFSGLKPIFQTRDQLSSIYELTVRMLGICVSTLIYCVNHSIPLRKSEIKKVKRHLNDLEKMVTDLKSV